MNGKIDRIKIIGQAERLVRAGKLREAIAEYEKLLEEDPNDVTINNTVGDLYVRLGQNERAIRHFERAANEYESKAQYSQALAILKKICRLNPENPVYFVRMADLYARQGFTAEAKKEYLTVAEKYLRAKKVEEAIELYEKVVRLDREDLNVRMQLAALYKLNGQIDRAVGELLEAADLKLQDGRIDEAHKLLTEARKLNPDNPRFSLKMAQVLRVKGQTSEAMALVQAALEKNPNDLEAQTFLGNLYFEEGKFQAAREIFTRILNYHPQNVNARYKMGRIHLAEGDIDRAFEFFEPLIDSYLKKKKEEKAIGLLGLILRLRRDHLPSMEKLAAILRESKDFKRLEQVDRAILAEYKKLGEKSKMLPYYAELVKLVPSDENLALEYRELKKELLVTEEEEAAYDTWVPSEEQEEEIRAQLAQADLYLKEGLVRLARRVVESLLLKYPNDPLLKQKLNYIDSFKPQLSEEELMKKVTKTSILETQLVKTERGRSQEISARTGTLTFGKEILDEEKVSPIDIFRETGIIPIISSDGREKKYYDLSSNLRAELAAISAFYLRQKQGIMSQYEKELTSIVKEFKKGIMDKIPEDDYQIHLQLGLAFMEQGLLDEAIEEFNLASRDKNLLLECLNLISNCYRLKGNLEEAERWMNRAIKLVAPGSDQYFALLFDLGLIYEVAGDKERALSVYREIQSWNPTYRGISDKIEKLEGMSDTPSNPLN